MLSFVLICFVLFLLLCLIFVCCLFVVVLFFVIWFLWLFWFTATGYLQAAASAADSSSTRWTDESINWRCLGDIQKPAGSEVSPPLWRPVATCGNLWLLWIHVLLHSNLQEVAVKLFEHFSTEIFMVLEASGGCCESIIAGLESPRSCCEAIYVLLQRNIDGLGNFRRLLRIHYWWFGTLRRLLWSHLHTFSNEILKCQCKFDNI